MSDRQHSSSNNAAAAFRAAAKQSTFRSVAFVVILGIVLLIWFLATESEDGGHKAAHGVFLRGWGTAIDDEETVHEGEASSSGGGEHAPADVAGNANDHDHDDHSNGKGNIAPPPTTTAAAEGANADNSGEPKYYFDLDKPQRDDEAAFIHRPKSKGGVLNAVPENNGSWTVEMKETAGHLYKIFSIFDQNETSPQAMPVYGTMCVGRDCKFIPLMISKLNIGIGHFIVIVNTDDKHWIELFTTMQEAFPGRFSTFIRPEKLSCAESWNLVIRMGFSIRPSPAMVFISNADWHPRATGKTDKEPAVENNMARFCEWAHKNLHLVLNRYFHFSSFAYTKKGFFELGYFDAVIYPAIAEDVEFHIKAVSKNMGELGLYDHWHSGSVHVNRASIGDSSSRVIDERNARVARHDYILRKWNVRVGSVRDYAVSTPFRHPFNIPHLHHNNSWVLDPDHRKCANTGDGIKMSPTQRCWWNAEVLRKLLPESVRDSYVLEERLKTRHDSFSHPSFF